MLRARRIWSRKMGGDTHPLVVALDGASLVTIVLALAGLLPPIASLFAMAWYGVQIYESSTVQEMLEKRRARKAAKTPRVSVSSEVDDSLR